MPKPAKPFVPPAPIRDEGQSDFSEKFEACLLFQQTQVDYNDAMADYFDGIGTEVETITTDAVATITTARDDAAAYIDGVQTASEASIISTRDAAETYITTAKNDAETTIESTKLSAVATITTSKNDAEAYILSVQSTTIDNITTLTTSSNTIITTARDDAAAYIEGVQAASEASIISTRDAAETYITTAKNDAETYITTARDDAAAYIEGVQAASESSIISTRDDAAAYLNGLLPFEDFVYDFSIDGAVSIVEFLDLGDFSNIEFDIYISLDASAAAVVQYSTDNGATWRTTGYDGVAEGPLNGDNYPTDGLPVVSGGSPFIWGLGFIRRFNDIEMRTGGIFEGSDVFSDGLLRTQSLYATIEAHNALRFNFGASSTTNGRIVMRAHP